MAEQRPRVHGRQPIRSRPSLIRVGAVLGWAVALCGLLLWPLTHGGYLLGHDMVFTPRQPLDLASIGVSSASPRAVPLDALVALAERIADGAVVGRIALVLPVLAAGLGAAALLGSRSVSAQLATCAIAIWNPFVIERLALGQWALIWAYAAVPWLVLAISRTRGRGGWLGRAAALAGASITPTGGLIAGATAVAVVVGLRRPKRELLATIGLTVIFQLPWLLPAFLSSAAATSDPAAVVAFSARSEGSGGTVLSLLGGGGIWDRDVVPHSRAGVLPWVWLALLVAAAAYGAHRLAVLIGRRLLLTLTGGAGVGLLLAALPLLPGGASAVRAAVAHVPGAGLLRDSQKWVLPLVLLEALLIGAAVQRLAERLRAVPPRAALAVAVVAVPLIVLPDAAATLRPTLDPVRYPRDWAAVSRSLRRGDVAVLPWGSYRSFAWAPGRSVLDPAPRLLPVTTVVDDRLAVSGHLLTGEDLRAREVGRVLTAGAALADRLARLGIGWLVVEHGTPGDLPDLSALRPAYRGSDVSLYVVPARVAEDRPSAARIAAVVTGDLLALLALLTLVAWAAWGRIGRGRSTDPTRSPGAGSLI